MLYRLSYASGGSKSIQAQYFRDPFLIVRDNYLRYHNGYLRRNPKIGRAVILTANQGATIGRSPVSLEQSAHEAGLAGSTPIPAPVDFALITPSRAAPHRQSWRPDIA